MTADSSSQSDAPGGALESGSRTLEQLQQELADTRSALQTEAAQLGALQDTLEAALRVARSVRLDPHTELDRLAQELLESARREADAVRERAEAEARELREQAEAEIRERQRTADAELARQREAVEAELANRRAHSESDLSEQRTSFEHYVTSTQTEFDRVAGVLQTAIQLLTRGRQPWSGASSAAALAALPMSAADPAAAGEAAAAASPPSAPADAYHAAQAAAPTAGEAAAEAAEAPPWSAGQEPTEEAWPLAQDASAASPAEATPHTATAHDGEDGAAASAAPLAAAATGEQQASERETADQAASADPAHEEDTLSLREPLRRTDEAPGAPAAEAPHAGAEPAPAYPFGVGSSMGAEGAPHGSAEAPPAFDEAALLGASPAGLAAEPRASESPGRPLSTPSGGSPYEQAAHLIEQGDVPAGLDGFRSIVDRTPEQVEPVIARLSALMQDTNLRRYHEEMRLLLVDAYMVQGDYDRAMSLLHEPGS